MRNGADSTGDRAQNHAGRPDNVVTVLLEELPLPGDICLEWLIDHFDTTREVRR